MASDPRSRADEFLARVEGEGFDALTPEQRAALLAEATALAEALPGDDPRQARLERITRALAFSELPAQAAPSPGEVAGHVAGAVGEGLGGTGRFLGEHAPALGTDPTPPQPSGSPPGTGSPFVAGDARTDPTASELLPGRQSEPNAFREFARLLAFGPLIDDLPDKTPGREIKRGQREALLEVARLGHTHAIVQEDGDIVPAPQPGLGRELRGLVDELDDWIRAASQPADDRPVQTREYRDPDTGLKRLYTIRLDPVTGRIDVSLPQPDGTDQWVPVHQTNLEDPSAATDPTRHTQEYFGPDGQPVKRTVRVRPDGTREVSLQGQWVTEADSGLSLEKPTSAATDLTRRSQLLYDSVGREVPSTMATLPDGTIVVGVGGQWVDFAASGLSFEKPVSAAATDAQATQDRWELLQTAIRHTNTHLDDLGAATKLDVKQNPVEAARTALAQTVGAFGARGLTPTQDEVFAVFSAIAGAGALNTDARTRLANSYQRMFADPEAALEVNGPFLPELTTRGVNVAGVADALAQGVAAGAYSVDDAMVVLDTTGRVAFALIGPEGFTDLGVDYDRYIQVQAQAVASGQVSPQDAQQDLLGLAQVVATAQQRKRDDASQRGQFAFQVEQENRRRQDDLRRERQALTQQAQAQEMDFLNFVLRTAQAGMLPGLTRGVPADLAGARDLAQRAGVTVDTPAAIAGGPLPFPDFRAGMEGAWADWAAAEAAPPLTVEGLQQGGPAP